jgi:hypothetical protein
MERRKDFMKDKVEDTGASMFFLMIMILTILFWGTPDIHDAVISYLMR